MGIGDESEERHVAKYPSQVVPVGIETGSAASDVGTVVNLILRVRQGEPAYGRACGLTPGRRVLLRLCSRSDVPAIEVLVDPNISLGVLEGPQAGRVVLDILLTNADYAGDVVAVLSRDSLCEVSVQVIRRRREATNAQ
jgi:hypothetical protein